MYANNSRSSKISQPKPNQFDRLLVLFNPASTRIGQVRERIAVLQGFFPGRPAEIIETGAGREANRALLCDHAPVLGPQTLLCIAAGDGTVNLAVETLLLDEHLPALARRTPILPLWGGNANDLAYMLNGSPTPASLRELFAHGRTVPIPAMRFRLTHKDGAEQIRFAACTASFGATALVAQHLNEQGYRTSPLHKLPGGRLLKEASVAWNTVMNAPTFPSEEKGVIKNMYEYTFAKGPRMAKLYHIPLKLTDNRFYFDAIEGKHFMTTATALSLSFRRKLTEGVLRAKAEFTVQRTIWAQFDGEELQIPAGTTVSADLSKRPYYALSTLLSGPDSR